MRLEPFEYRLRPPWDEYFLEIADAVSMRADCKRRRCGAVIVRNNRIFSTGYNGSRPGGPSCLAGECPRAQSNVDPGSSYDTGPGACIALHAEQNALLYASRDQCEGSTIYITDEPCDGCRRMIEGSGIIRIVTPERYRQSYDRARKESHSKESPGSEATSHGGSDRG